MAKCRVCMSTIGVGNICAFCARNNRISETLSSEVDRLNTLLCGAVAEHSRLRKLLRDVYITVIQVPVVYRGDAIRWARLCDDILHEIGEDPIKTALEYYILECDCGWGGTSEGLEEKQEWWECPKCSGTAQPPNEI